MKKTSGPSPTGLNSDDTWSSLRSSPRIFRNHQGHIGKVLVQEPLLQFVGAKHITNHEIIRALIPDGLGALRQLSAVTDDDLVRIEQS